MDKYFKIRSFAFVRIFCDFLENDQKNDILDHCILINKVLNTIISHI